MDKSHDNTLGCSNKILLPQSTLRRKKLIRHEILYCFILFSLTEGKTYGLYIKTFLFRFEYLFG